MVFLFRQNVNPQVSNINFKPNILTTIISHVKLLHTKLMRKDP